MQFSLHKWRNMFLITNDLSAADLVHADFCQTIKKCKSQEPVVIWKNTDGQTEPAKTSKTPMANKALKDCMLWKNTTDHVHCTVLWPADLESWWLKYHYFFQVYEHCVMSPHCTVETLHFPQIKCDASSMTHLMIELISFTLVSNYVLPKKATQK